MANIFRKPGKKVWWVNYRVDGKRIRRSLRTKDERIARKKVRKIEFDLLTGEIEPKTVTPLASFLEALCIHQLFRRTLQGDTTHDMTSRSSSTPSGLN